MGQKNLLKWERTDDMKLRDLIVSIRSSLPRETSEAPRASPPSAVGCPSSVAAYCGARATNTIRHSLWRRTRTGAQGNLLRYSSQKGYEGRVLAKASEEKYGK